jgi:hypothetical protein
LTEGLTVTVRNRWVDRWKPPEEDLDPLARADLDLSATILDTTRVRAIARNPDLHAFAFEAIPGRPPRAPGRKALFPDYIWVLRIGMTAAFGSARTAAAMADETYWGIVLTASRPAWGRRKSTSHRRFLIWSRAGVLGRLHEAVLHRLDDAGLIDVTRVVLDSAHVRA